MADSRTKKYLKSITLMLENVASIDIVASDVSSMTFTGIHENILKLGTSTVLTAKAVTDAVIVLRPSANRAFDIDGKSTDSLFDALSANDITVVRLNYRNGSYDEYHMFWGDIEFASNDYQRSDVVCGHLIVGIGIDRGPFSRAKKKLVTACERLRASEESSK